MTRHRRQVGDITDFIPVTAMTKTINAAEDSIGKLMALPKPLPPAVEQCISALQATISTLSEQREQAELDLLVSIFTERTEKLQKALKGLNAASTKFERHTPQLKEEYTRFHEWDSLNDPKCMLAARVEKGANSIKEFLRALKDKAPITSELSALSDRLKAISTAEDLRGFFAQHPDRGQARELLALLAKIISRIEKVLSAVNDMDKLMTTEFIPILQKPENVTPSDIPLRSFGANLRSINANMSATDDRCRCSELNELLQTLEQASLSYRRDMVDTTSRARTAITGMANGAGPNATKKSTGGVGKKDTLTGQGT